MTLRCLSIMGALAGALFSPLSPVARAEEACRIEVVEKDSGWPVPLVELRTTGNVRFITDNAGVIAFDLSELMGKETWFTVLGHGYEVPKDGFGSRGVRLTPRPGKTLRVEVERKVLARRLGRLTGAGRFSESQKLGMGREHRSPVIGCDSVQLAEHGGKLHWLWGDTTLAHYPLGIFHASSATTSLKPIKEWKPPLDINHDYFTDDKGRPRGVAKMEGQGPTWLTGMVSLPDEKGKPHLVAMYVKVKPPLEAYRWGQCEWDAKTERFEHLKTVWTKSEDQPKPPSLPEGHAVLWKDEEGKEWVLFGNPLPTLRCPATYEAWKDSSQWEVLKPQQTLEDAATGKPIRPHTGSIAWNNWRKRWVTVFMQAFGKPSVFGELWYAEADSPTGPWGPAVKVLSHDNYTFYNPRLHPEIGPKDSPILIFEGTYTAMFADKPRPTPKYDYNQILYRLDLDDPALALAQGRKPKLERIKVSKDGSHFVGADSGKRFIVWGVNYDHDGPGRLLEDYWHDEWKTVEEDFKEIRDLGANVVRIHLQLPKLMTDAKSPNEKNLNKLKDLVRLAERTGLYLDLTGLGCYHKKDVPKWYDALDEEKRWAVQARFWQAVAKVCKDSPAVFCYDLMNEPILPGKDKKETEWLTGELGGKHFVQRITLDLKDRSRHEVAKAWVRHLTSAIREVDDSHMITVGVIPWAHVFKGAKPLFHDPEVGKPLDFVSVHFYPKKGDIESSLEALKVYEIGKPLVVEEIFPLKCGIEEVMEFIQGSRKFADGWISFYWGKTIKENRAAGDLKGAIVAEWLETFQSQAEKMKEP